MTNSHSGFSSSGRALLLIAATLVLYVAAVIAGAPQRMAAGVSVAEGTEAVQQPAGPPLWTIGPFVVLLGCIAVMPLVPRAAHWWEDNRHKLIVAGVLAAVTLAYYLFLHPEAIHSEWPAAHWVRPLDAGGGAKLALAVFLDAIMGSYVPFLILLLSLYTISGGIRLTGDLPAHPLTNTLFLACGAVLASVIGTTGAAMLLIRPLLATNSERRHVRHTVVFFIFIVCNCGGCLLPTGDPPLFLGYLLGVPFLWTLKLWKAWLVINGLLLVIYYLWDRFFCYPREAVADITRDEINVMALRVWGLWPNGVLLLAVVACAGLLDPSRPVPLTDWRPWLYLREMVLLALTGLSLLVGPEPVRRANGFNFAAIGEVAALFLGIFICMQPALMLLAARGSQLGLASPAHYFWASGGLSSFLDNAPTYVVFFNAARSCSASVATSGSLVAAASEPLVAGVRESLLAAVSLGAVLMGANTYIGNGPNFMVRSIAEASGVKMPSFFGYMGYSLIILVPLFLLATFVFF